MNPTQRLWNAQKQYIGSLSLVLTIDKENQPDYKTMRLNQNGINKFSR